MDVTDVTKVCNDIKELDNDTQLALSYLMEAMDKEGIEYRIFETYRSQERQNYLYSQGRTRPGQIITWTTQSYHITRRAVDIIHPKYLWDRPTSYWKKIAELATEVGFSCGYYWKKQDRPHIQLNKGVIPRKIVKEETEEEYMKINQNVEINGIKGQIEVIQDKGRTYLKASDLELYGIETKWDEESKTVLLKNETIAQKINVDGVMDIVDAVKICDRIFVKAADMKKLGFDVNYSETLGMVVMISKE